jgi:hypothetical protein
MLVIQAEQLWAHWVCFHMDIEAPVMIDFGGDEPGVTEKGYKVTRC